MEGNVIMHFMIGLNIGLALMLFIVLYYIDKYQSVKRDYEELRREALFEISSLRKELMKKDSSKSQKEEKECKQ